jgi:Cu(I)/Ag(I) efflux system membrane protein CusA/SilA
MWSTGAGADVMKRIATPMVGGVITSFILELLIYPVIYAVWKGRREVRRALDGNNGDGAHSGGPLMTPGEH